MDILKLKWLITLWLGVGGLVLAGWAGAAWWRGRALGGGYAGVLKFVHLLAAVQIGMGVLLVSRGHRADPMHMLYGVALGLVAVVQQVTAPRPANPEGRGAVWAFVLALMMLGLVARAWITST